MDDDLNNVGSNPLEKNSCLESRTSRVVCSIRIKVPLFFKLAALLLVSSLCYQQATKFVFAKLANGVVWNTSYSWISAPCVMFVVVNIIITTLGINCAVLRFSANSERMDNPFIEEHMQLTAAIEDFNLNKISQEEGYLNLWSTLEIENSTDVSCEKHLTCQRTRSGDSVESLTSNAEKDSFIISADTDMSGSISVGYRVLKSANSIPTANQKVEESLNSSPPLFLLEISDGKADIYTQYSHDVAEEGEHFNGDELFLNCENFIKNFKRQLKMQRENSLKRIHEIYTESC